MKGSLVVRVDSNDGDTHYVFLESLPSEKNHYIKDYDEVKLRQASKREASKLLILNRDE